MSTLPAVEEILKETGTPMSVREIVEYSKGSLPTRSKTPDTVVARDLSMDIKRKGADSMFCRVSPGRYTLRTLADTGSEGATSMIASAITQERAGTLAKESPSVSDSAESSASPSR